MLSSPPCRADSEGAEEAVSPSNSSCDYQHHPQSSMSYGGGYGGKQQYGNAPPAYGAPSGAPPGAEYGQGPPPPPGRPGPGGFAAESTSGPPPGADPKLWHWFSSVDADRSGAITAAELQQALVNGDWSPFDIDTVQLLMSIFDTDHSGTIGFNEFAGLWKYVKDWQGVFRHFDVDRSGTIDGQEMANALRQFGYNLSPQLVSLLERKYNTESSVPGTRGPAPGITFDRFVRACVVVKTLTESFQRLDTDRDGWIQINYDTFMQTILAAP